MKCWAFCPPGGLVSANLSAVMAPFCTSVIVGKDAISRVSLHNLAAMMGAHASRSAVRCSVPLLELVSRQVSVHGWCLLHFAVLLVKQHAVLSRGCPVPGVQTFCFSQFVFCEPGGVSIPQTRASSRWRAASSPPAGCCSA